MELPLKRARQQIGVFARAVLALLITATLVPVASLASPDAAYAASGPPASLSVSGTVTGIAGYDSLGPNAFYMDLGVEGDYDVVSYGHNSPYFDDKIALCISPGNPYPPAGTSSWGTFDWVWNDEDAGIAWYKGTFWFSDVPNSKDMPYQNLGEIYIGIRWQFDGWAKLVKTSSAPDISNGNADYSLAGAVYELHRASDRVLIDTITTDETGVATTKGVSPGDYYLIEVAAPVGYKIDSSEHPVTVISNSTAVVEVADEPLVRLAIAKRSSVTDVTDNNACYSLAGAVYGLYRSEADALADTNRVTTLETDAAGHATSELVERGHYYIREVTAPLGYARDTTTYPTDLDIVLTRLELYDAPQGNPVTVAVVKLDGDTLSQNPQGDASLGGAQFTIDYYDGYYDSAEDAIASGAPTHTWIVRTDETGTGYLDEAHLTSGSDALYRNSSGNIIIPLGTVLVRETKAPANYVLPDPAPVEIRTITANTDAEAVLTYNPPKISDTVARGDISITKAYDPTPDDDTGEMVPEANITFDFYASQDFDGQTPKDNTSPAFTLATGEDGRADTSGIYVVENADGTYSQRPRTDDDAGGIPYGTYLMVQRNSPDGLEKAKPMLVFVSENGKTYDYLLQNGTVQTALSVVKVDAETGLRVPYPASWQIIDTSSGEPVSMTTHYPTTQTFDVFTSDALGRLVLPEKLPWGDYELHEVSAPANAMNGYTLNSLNVAFSTEEGHDWDNPLEVVFSDMPAKGQIELVKADANTGEAIAGAVYTVQAAEDIYTLDGTLRAQAGEVVDTITTDEEGKAATCELYLGHYDVIEAISPEGFALDTTRYSVVLEYESQDVPLVVHTLELTDMPTTLRIEKVDALTKEPMAYVEFRVTSADGLYEQVVLTGEDGIAELGYIPHGEYTVTETVPLGYTSDVAEHTFTVDDQGLIEGKDLFVIEVANTPLQVTISKTDIATSEEVPGCAMEVYEADEDGTPVGDAIYSWISSTEPYVIADGLVPGDYVLREASAAAGYVASQDVTFTVQDTGEVQRVSMVNDFTKLDIAKLTADANALSGASLALYKLDDEGNCADKPLHEWVSGTEPLRFERLEVGRYVLVEVSTPTGYELAADMEFSVEATPDVQNVSMVDEQTPVVPEASEDTYDKTGFTPAPLIALLVFLGAGSALGLCMGIKRRRAAGQTDDATLDSSEDTQG